MMNLKDYLAAAEKRVVRETFGEGEAAFEVELRLCSRSDLDSMRKKATTDVKDRITKQWTKEVDPVKLRAYLRDHCVTGWAGLTYAKAVTLCNRTVPNGDLAQFANAAVEFSPDAVDMLLT